MLFSGDIPVTKPAETLVSEVQEVSSPVQTTVNAHSGHYGMKHLLYNSNPIKSILNQENQRYLIIVLLCYFRSSTHPDTELKLIQ